MYLKRLNKEQRTMKNCMVLVYTYVAILKYSYTLLHYSTVEHIHCVYVNVIGQGGIHSKGTFPF